MQRNVEKFGFSDKRGRVRTSTDPYLPETGLKEPTLCERCHAVYRQKGWHLDPEAVSKLADDPATQWMTCPGCQKVVERYPEGILTLRGTYLWNHEKEIRNILDNAVSRFAGHNPLGQIIRMQRTGDALIIETTANKLAEHLGRFLQRAHSGELQIDWQGSPVVCRVQWERWH